MLKDKLKTVIKAVDGTNVKISEYAGMAAPNIGKLTNGSRVPARQSSTAHKLGYGIYGFCEANGKLGVLCETIGCSTAIGEKNIRKALLDWLYEDVLVLDAYTEKFTQRLNDLISTVGVSVPEICAGIGIATTLLDTYCCGVKIPTRRSKYLVSICGFLYRRARNNDDLGSVAELLGVRENDLSDESASLMIRDWLIGKNDDAGNKAAASIISQITSPSPPSVLIPEFNTVARADILSEKTMFYTGISGLQRAVIRFLGNAAKNPGSELLLYSDQSMEWMQQARFIPKWRSLMRECLKNGVRIKIIHNIDRDPSEMLFALRSWLPLYMTGLIESYYRPDTSGSRFCHTVFISANDCIDGFCTVGTERDCVYRYSSDGEYIGHIRRSYEKLTHSVKPLVKFERGLFNPSKEYEVFDCGDVRIYISYKEVVVFRTSAPQCSFVLKHNYLIQIFSLYARSFGQKKTA